METGRNRTWRDFNLPDSAEAKGDVIRGGINRIRNEGGGEKSGGVGRRGSRAEWIISRTRKRVMAGRKRGGIYGGHNASRVSMTVALSSILKLMRCERIAQAEGTGGYANGPFAPQSPATDKDIPTFVPFRVLRSWRGSPAARNPPFLGILRQLHRRRLLDAFARMFPGLRKARQHLSDQFFCTCSSPSDRNAPRHAALQESTRASRANRRDD